VSFFSRSKRLAQIPERLDVILDGEPVTVRLRTHPRARRYTLRVGRAGSGPSITIPPGGSLDHALAFLESHRDWLESRLNAIPEDRPFADGGVVPIRGVEHRIRHRAGKRGTVWLEADSRGPVVAVAGDPEHLARRLTDWLKREARRDLERAVFKHAAKIDARPTAIRLRDPKGRWGSCSSKGTLSFSWRLILAPPMVLDYLAAHEVVHLRYMHHRPSFWRLLREICPDTGRAEAWLKAHGASLHIWGAPEED
jgi:predicted metal-dependent hydrolase